MGYGLPAAIGAKVARPEALVVDIDGVRMKHHYHMFSLTCLQDASFNMTLTELCKLHLGLLQSRR